MPVIVRIKCPKCKGETDLYNERCLACEIKDLFKTKDGSKHSPSYFSSKERKGLISNYWDDVISKNITRLGIRGN